MEDEARDGSRNKKWLKFDLSYLLPLVVISTIMNVSCNPSHDTETVLFYAI